MKTEARYYLKVYTSAGVLSAVVTDFEALTYRNTINAPGICVFTLDGEDEAVSSLTDDAQVEVHRKLVDVTDDSTILDWHVDWSGMFKDYEVRYSEGRYKFVATCVGWLTLLQDREILYYAGTANRTSFSSTKAETIMKTLVSYNAGPSATTGNGRIRTGTITGLTVQTDSAGGNTISHSCAWDNLLAALQSVAKVGGGDFDLIKTGATAWEFRFYPGQRGTDRSAYLVFSLERGNIATPVLTRIRSKEKTAVIALGRGEQSDRRVRVVTGDNYSPGNNIEYAYNASGIDDTDAALDAQGAYIAKTKKLSVDFSFQIIQTDSSRYGVHYFLGDLGFVSFLNYSDTLKVASVEIKYSRTEGEAVTVEVADYD